MKAAIAIVDDLVIITLPQGQVLPAAKSGPPPEALKRQSLRATCTQPEEWTKAPAGDALFLLPAFFFAHAFR
jgi:hypothetical protein